VPRLDSTAVRVRVRVRARVRARVRVRVRVRVSASPRVNGLAAIKRIEGAAGSVGLNLGDGGCNTR
jgi:hypothetical protein